jgi:2-succinyl-5-enolpyruvyl-6-hydroxy-3-cyclohexene-1-carboxylate synthase
VRALATADGLRKGPVHLNFPFRRPLEPDDPLNWQTLPVPSKRPSFSITHGTLEPTADQVATLTDLLADRPRGLIIAGPRCPGADFVAQLAELAALTGFPIFADPLSGLRFGPHVDGQAIICGAYETYLHHAPPSLQPQVILRFGAMPVSKRLGDFLAHCDSAVQVHVRESGVWADEAHVVDLFLQVDPAALCKELIAKVKMSRDAAWAGQWSTLENMSRQIGSEFMRKRPFDGAYVAAALDVLPPGTRLLAGNSLPVRHVDQFGELSATPLHIVANRGASGIDGNISTGMGLAAAANQPVVILVGDITFYHDSNGLLAARALGLNNVTIVLLNNNGGGIFQRLPISRFEPPFQELFQTPHDLDFAFFAQAYGFNYQIVDGLDSFREALARCIATPEPAILEVQTNAKVDLMLRQELEKQVAAALKEF